MAIDDEFDVIEQLELLELKEDVTYGDFEYLLNVLNTTYAHTGASAFITDMPCHGQTTHGLGLFENNERDLEIVYSFVIVRDRNDYSEVFFDGQLMIKSTNQGAYNEFSELLDSYKQIINPPAQDKLEEMLDNVE